MRNIEAHGGAKRLTLLVLLVLSNEGRNELLRRLLRCAPQPLTAALASAGTATKGERQAFSPSGLINKGADKLTKKQQDIIKEIKGIVVRDNVTRSGTNLRTGIFTIVKTPDLIYSKENSSYPSASWIAGIIIHDSLHPDQYKRGLSFSGDKNGAAREREANEFAAQVGGLIGLDNDTVQAFKDYAQNPGTRYKEPFKTTPRSRPSRRKTP